MKRRNRCGQAAVWVDGDYAGRTVGGVDSDMQWTIAAEDRERQIARFGLDDRKIQIRRKRYSSVILVGYFSRLGPNLRYIDVV